MGLVRVKELHHAMFSTYFKVSCRTVVT